MRHRSRRQALLATVALGASVLAVGCGSSGGSGGGDNVKLTQGGNLKFAVVTPGDAGQFWSVFKKGAEQAGQAVGAKISYTESNNDPQKQAQMIDAAVTQKVDGIVVTAPNPEAIKDSLAKAKAAGIPYITSNSGSDQSKALGAITHVGQDETIAGEAAGKRIKSEGGTKVLCIIHEQGNVGLNQRCDGVKKGFGGTVTNLQVKGTGDLSTTEAEIKSKLQADKSYDWIVTLNNDIAATAVQSRKESNSKAKQATFDLSGDVVKAIQAGDIAFAVDQQQYLQGYLPVVFLALYKNNANTVGGGYPVLTGPGMVDKTNADTVAKLAEAGTR